MAVNQPPERRILLWSLFAAVVAASVGFHAWLLLTTAGVWWDLAAYREHAYAALHGLNVYAYTPRYPYFPVWVWIAGLMAKVSSLGVPFRMAIKLPACAADLAVTGLLFWRERARFGLTTRAVLVPALWALNPVPAILAAGHGQWDSLPVLFLLIAVLLLERSSEHPNRRYLAALALGVSISLKPYTVLFLPYLAFTTRRGRRLAVTATVWAPVLLSMAVYTLATGFDPRMITHVVGYTSAGDIGLAALLRFMSLGLSTPAMFVAYILTADLLVAWALTLSRLFPTKPVLAAAAVFAGFYVLTPRGSVQYIVAGLPFVVLASRRYALAYGLTGTALLVGFYAVAFPGALPSDLPLSGFPGAVWFYAGGLVGLMLVSAALAFELWRRREPAPAPERASRSFFRRPTPADA